MPSTPMERDDPRKVIKSGSVSISSGEYPLAMSLSIGRLIAKFLRNRESLGGTNQKHDISFPNLEMEDKNVERNWRLNCSGIFGSLDIL